MKNDKEIDKLSAIIPVRIGDVLLRKIDEVSEGLSVKKQEAMRLCMEIGAHHLKNINYDLPKAVLQMSNDNNINISNSDSPVIAIGSKNTKTKVKTKK